MSEKAGLLRHPSKPRILFHPLTYLQIYYYYCYVYYYCWYIIIIVMYMFRSLRIGFAFVAFMRKAIQLPLSISQPLLFLLESFINGLFLHGYTRSESMFQMCYAESELCICSTHLFIHTRSSSALFVPAFWPPGCANSPII